MPDSSHRNNPAALGSVSASATRLGGVIGLFVSGDINPFGYQIDMAYQGLAALAWQARNRAIAKEAATRAAKFDADVAARFAQSHANEKSVHLCARYTIAAIGAGFGLEESAIDPEANIKAGVVVPLIEKKLGRVPGDVPNDAKDYGPVLVRLGFLSVSSVPQPAQGATIPDEPTGFQKGDVMIFQGYDNDKGRSGHIQIYTGAAWVSDFIQHDPVWPNTSLTSQWKKLRPAHTLYRYPNS